MFIKWNYVLIPLIGITTLVFGGYVTQLGMTWYKTALKLPTITPPAWVFPIAWNIIFALTIISALYAWNKIPNTPLMIKMFFITNALLNALWSVLFFYFHSPGLALLDLIALQATLIGLIVTLIPYSYYAAFLLLPYALWTMFAGILNLLIWLIN